MHASAERKIVGVAAAVLALSAVVIAGLLVARIYLFGEMPAAPPPPTMSRSEILNMLQEAQKAEDWNRRDYVKAARLYRTLAGQGEPRAQYRLGELYADGKGVERDDAAAAYWYRRAADQGHALAMDALGQAIFRGDGVDERNFGEMAQLYQKAADLGLTRAKFHLAICYERGWGVKQDYVMAYVWLSAVLKDDQRDPGWAEFASGNLKDVWKKMTPRERTIAKDKVAAMGLD